MDVINKANDLLDRIPSGDYFDWELLEILPLLRDRLTTLYESYANEHDELIRTQTRLRLVKAEAEAWRDTALGACELED